VGCGTIVEITHKVLFLGRPFDVAQGGEDCMAVKPIPDGFNSVSAYLVASDVEKAIGFYSAPPAKRSL
jgi:hypothetical protein